MKRSEALTAIVDLVHEYRRNTLGVTSEQLGNMILSKLEVLGMSPPSNHNKYDPVPSVTPIGNLNYSFIKEWEEET